MKKTSNILRYNATTDREASNLRMQTESLYKEINTTEISSTN